MRSGPDDGALGAQLARMEGERDTIESERMRLELRTRLFGDAAVPTHVDRFIVLRRLGAGGMGVVYAAYDPQLERNVALKLVRTPDPETWASHQERLLREARALARLSHPNVIGVFEAGTHGRDVFIAMELVEGSTLDAYCRAAKRGREIIDAYLQAGEGLAAAHAAGLVHRDFKPQNVLVGEDGRVRVLDFGLARAHAHAEASDGGSGSSGWATTTEGKLLGTPAYMAPEQRSGSPATLASDQFAFCASLHESLTGSLPRVEVAPDRLELARLGLPRHLRAVLARGLAIDPMRRWPTMHALLRELRRAVNLRGRVRVAGAAVLIGLAGAALWAGDDAYSRYQHAQIVAGCDADGAAIADTWNDEARMLVGNAIVATGLSHAETTAGHVTRWLDKHAHAWQRARTEACLATEARGQWDDDTLDRSLWCLDDHRLRLDALVTQLSSADTNAANSATLAAASLPGVDECIDANRLARLPAPPAPEQRDEVRNVRRMLAHAAALQGAGNVVEALPLARAARERAETLPWPPLLSAGLLREALLHKKQGAFAEAREASTRAYFEAARVGAWDLAADAATSTAGTFASGLGRPADARAWADHAAIAIAHAEDAGGVREAMHSWLLANIDASAGAYAEARTEYQHAIGVIERALGPDHPKVAEVITSLGDLEVKAGEYSRAIRLHGRALAVMEEALGPGHPDSATVIENLAIVHAWTGDYPQARQLFERTLAIREAAFGSRSIPVATTLTNLGQTHTSMGDYSGARTLLERALAILERELGPEHRDLAIVQSNLGSVLGEIGDGQAAEHHERAVAIAEKALGPDHPELATYLANLGMEHLSAGEWPEARALLERALAIRERSLGSDNPRVIPSLLGLAGVYLRLGSGFEARGAFERALALGEKHLEPTDPMLASCYAGLAMVDIDARDLDPALRHAERAVAIYDQHDGVEQGELEARFLLAALLAGTDPDRAGALEAQARAGWDALGGGGTRDRNDMEAWLRRATSAGKLRVRSRRLIATPRATQ